LKNKPEERDSYVREYRYHSGEVYLAENVLIVFKDIGTTGKCLQKNIPKNNCGKKSQKRVLYVSRSPKNFLEDHNEYST
jgi:hypothetical protein